jgi:IS5 family transposase
VDTTVVEADIDYPTDADLLEQAVRVRKLGGLVRRTKARGAATGTPFRDRGRAAGRRIRQLARTLRRRTGLRRLPGAKTWVGLGVFAYNLQRMTVVAAG